MGTTRVGRGIWAAWSLAFVGGLAVLLATALVITDPCVEGGRRVTTQACAAAGTDATVAGLVLGGTAVAVVGGLVATVLTVRRLAPRPSGDRTGRGPLVGRPSAKHARRRASSERPRGA